MRKFPSMTVFFASMCTVIFFCNKYLSAHIPLNFTNLIYVPNISGMLSAMTAAFLHFGYFHLIGNLVYLALFGRYIEDRLGPVLFTLIFMSGATLGNFLQGLYNTHVLNNPYVGIIGASGAISAILGVFSVRFLWSKLRIAYWVFFPLQAFTKGGVAEVPAVLAVALWFIIQAVGGLVQFGGGSGSVAYVTHISAFTCGLGWALLLGQGEKGKVEAIWKKAQTVMQRGDHFGAQAELLKLVDKRPDDGTAHASLARTQLLSHDDHRSRMSYIRACELLLRDGKRGEAENVYREALRGFGDLVLSAPLQLDLAFGLERDLKPDLALQAYNNFKLHYPEHSEAPFALLRAANLYWNTISDLEMANHCYQQLVDRYPDDAWVDFAREQIRVISSQHANGRSRPSP